MELNTNYNWENNKHLSSRSFTCGYCGKPLASEKGFSAVSRELYNKVHRQAYIYICHFCTRPTFIDFDDSQVPGVSYGNDVIHISDSSVEQLYQEARRATSANCYTSAVLSCRKLLMHIAVSKGAEEGKSFASYVKYLSDHHFVPPGAQVWVDHIREKGNEANHEINIMKPEEAKELIDFCEMPLKIIYEFPTNVQNKYLKKDKDVEENNDTNE